MSTVILGRVTLSELVVFGGPGDLILLGTFGLEGLNMPVDLGRKELVPAGPVPAAFSNEASSQTPP